MATTTKTKMPGKRVENGLSENMSPSSGSNNRLTAMKRIAPPRETARSLKPKFLIEPENTINGYYANSIKVYIFPSEYRDTKS